jgi:hypothetical protein
MNAVNQNQRRLFDGGHDRAYLLQIFHPDLWNSLLNDHIVFLFFFIVNRAGAWALPIVPVRMCEEDRKNRFSNTRPRVARHTRKRISRIGASSRACVTKLLYLHAIVYIVF